LLLRVSVVYWARGAILFAAIVAACALGAAPAAARARCHGSFPNFLGYSYCRLDVTVYYRRNMTCSQAVQLGQRAYSLPHLHAIPDPSAFGGGGYGGPFQVGHFACFLNARGSDFRQAYCAWSGRPVYFYEHREVLPG
jgi:hypothetical protein